MTRFCPHGYCKCSSLQCIVDLNNPDTQCTNHRSGTLCGKCPANRSVGLRWYECIEECEGSWILPVVIVIVILLCVFIIWLNPSISSELRGPLFFFQALPLLFSPSSSLREDVTNIFANTFNFGGPLVFLKRPWCIQKGITNLNMVAIGYLMPLVTLGVFLLLFVLSTKNLVRLKLRRRSYLHSFWLLLLFMYHYLGETTFLILNCPKVTSFNSPYSKPSSETQEQIVGRAQNDGEGGG